MSKYGKSQNIVTVPHCQNGNSSNTLTFFFLCFCQGGNSSDFWSQFTYRLTLRNFRVGTVKKTTLYIWNQIPLTFASKELICTTCKNTTTPHRAIFVMGRVYERNTFSEFEISRSKQQADPPKKILISASSFGTEFRMGKTRQREFFQIYRPISFIWQTI